MKLQKTQTKQGGAFDEAPYKAAWESSGGDAAKVAEANGLKDVPASYAEYHHGEGRNVQGLRVELDNRLYMFQSLILVIRCVSSTAGETNKKRTVEVSQVQFIDRMVGDPPRCPRRYAAWSTRHAEEVSAATPRGEVDHVKRRRKADEQDLDQSPRDPNADVSTSSDEGGHEARSEEKRKEERDEQERGLQ